VVTPPVVTPPVVTPPASKTPSANDTVVLAGSKAAITDASGNLWTITSGGQVAVNGTTDTATANVIELAYVGGTIWQENASKLWWGETKPNDSWAPAAGTATSPLPATPVTPPVVTPPVVTPPATKTPSANDTVVLAGSKAAITDASGNLWTITSGGQVAINGTTDKATANVTELAYVNGTIWQENASKLWWGETKPNDSWAPAAGTSTSPLPATPVTPPVVTPPVVTPPVVTPPVTKTPSANDTVVLAGSSAAITDASGNLWTITSGGQVAVNGTTDTATANVTELAYVAGTIWQENASALWWGETKPNDSWAPAAGTATSPLPASPGTPPPVVTPPVTSGSRDPSQTPFASTSVFNLPLGSGAQWQANAQLSSSNAFINTANGSGYNENIYTGTASDPLVTVTNTAGAGGTSGTFQVHIPAGAVPAPGGDETLSVDDTVTHTWYGFGGFQWTSATTATVNQGSGESDYGSGITVANSNWDEGVGTLRESDLKGGTIDHMLRMELPTDMLESYSKTSTSALAPYAWPQTAEDGFAINGNGGPAYSGTIPFGVTVGIPASAVEPAAVAANAGANMLWKALQDHGAMVRDSGGSGNTVIFQGDQNVSQNDPLILGMEQYSAQIMAATEILANQGPNSVNGGGTPIVALDPAPSDAPVAAAATTNAVASPVAAPVSIAASQASVTISQNQASVTATGGNHMLFISGTGDSVNLTGGTDTITDTGSANTYILPAAGNGYDTFTGTAAANILTNGDTLDLRPALAATNWNGAASTLPGYLTVADTAAGAVVSVAPTSGGAGVAIATIGGATTASFSDVLAHALT
jgi:ribosomal protein S11